MLFEITIACQHNHMNNFTHYKLYYKLLEYLPKFITIPMAEILLSITICSTIKNRSAYSSTYHYRSEVIFCVVTAIEH